MATRGARRRRRSTQGIRLQERLRQFVTGWSGLVTVSVLLVVVVLVQGILRLPLPFGVGERQETPDPWGYVTVPRGELPKVVFVADVSGGKNVEESGAKYGIEQALNERGQVRNTSFELAVVEDTCDAAAATLKAQELAADVQVVGIISEACAASGIAAKAVYEEQKLPYFVMGTAPELTGRGTRVTYRLRWNERNQARLAATYARGELQVARAMVLTDGTAEANTTSELFRSQFRVIGGRIADGRALGDNTAEIERLAADARVLDVNYIYYIGNGRTGALVLRALKDGDYEGHFVVARRTHIDPDYLAVGPAALEGTFATNMQTPRADQYAFWKETYEKDYGPVQPLSQEGYDATNILLSSVDVAARESTTGALEFGRQLLTGIIRVLPYAGITGQFGYQLTNPGDRTTMLITMNKFEDGEYRQVAGQGPLPTPEPQDQNIDE